MKLNEWQLWITYSDRAVMLRKAYDRAKMLLILNAAFSEKEVVKMTLYVPKKVRDRG